MAWRGTTVEQIASLEPIEGADLIEKATLNDISYEFVVPKGEYKVGEKVLYFEIDSILPQWLLKEMGLEGKLSGKQKNRVKTVRLKGQISQGVVAKLDLIPEGLHDASSEELNEFLGVEKHEPPVVVSKNTNLKSLPPNVSIYDIDGCDRNPEVVDYLLHKPVLITEKIEGSNGCVYYSAQTEKIHVCSRRHTLELKDENIKHNWIRAAEKQGIYSTVEAMAIQNPLEDFGIYFEVVGPSIQKNPYGFDDINGFVFDIITRNGFYNSKEFFDFINRYNLATVPTLYYGDKLCDLLDGKTVAEFSHGNSVLNNNILREGIVIRPLEEEYLNRFGRLIIKQRDPIYLSKSKD